MTNGWKVILPDYVNVSERRRRAQEMAEKMQQAAMEAETKAIAKQMATIAAEAEAMERRILIERTGRIKQDSLSRMLAEATDPKEERILPDVTHWILSETSHLYSIKITGDTTGLDSVTPALTLQPSTAMAHEVEFVNSNMTLLILTDGVLTNLPAFVNGLARIGRVCYWNEMEMRARKSQHFDPHFFQCITNSSAIQTLDDIWKTKEIGSSSTLSIAGKKGEAKINVVKAMCDRVNQTVVRVFDDSGKYIWESPQSFAHAILHCIDMNGDGLDDIVVRSEDHGSITIVVYEQRPVPSSHRKSLP
jgi:hypothetical protein